MTEVPRPGARDNGLRCAGYTAVADLDPRVADAWLGTLREEGIAAYVAPASTHGWSLEAQLPDRPTDRLYVDATHAPTVRVRVAGENAEPAQGDIDFDAAWEGVLESLRAPSAVPGRTYSAVDVPRPEPVDEPEGHDPADDEHYVPPPAPPLPRLRRVTLAALTAIVLGLVVLATDFAGGGFTPVAILAIIGGVVSLVWHMRNGPPDDSGWDDGAVV